MDALEYSFDGAYAEVAIPEVNGHQMIVMGGDLCR